MRRCPHCGSAELVESHARGDVVCGACGEVLEENTMVAESGFAQATPGTRAVAGPSISFNPNSLRSNFNGQSSHEMAVHRGITKLRFIAERLGLGTEIQEPARGWYQLAMQMNFSAGRTTRFVASACLYVECRRKGSPHLLIDFSDVLQTPVKCLGQVYMRLVRRLVGADPQYHVPVVDPSIFIDRFARELEFNGGGKYEKARFKVQNTAMRLIQFMHRDWICLGRRPNGLCGAALLVAAYYHGFQFSARKVADVVRMKEDTLRVRLQEMRDTPLAQMTREQFEAGEPEVLKEDERTEPPCLKRRKRREKMLAALQDAEERKAIEDREKLALLDKAREADRTAMPPPPLPLARPGTGRLKRVVPAEEGEPGSGDGSAASSGGGGSGNSGDAAVGAPDAAAAPRVGNATAGGSSSSTSVAASPGGSAGTEAPGAVARAGGGGSAAAGAGNGAIVPLDRGLAEKYTAREPSEEDIQDIVQDIAGQHGIQALLQGEGPGSAGWGEAAARVGGLEAGRPAFEGLPLAQRGSGSCDDAADAASASGSIDLSEHGRGQEETLSDVDDEELESYLLDEEERKHKSDIWHEVNKDYLEEWHRRAQEARREARRRKQQSGQSGTSQASDTASDTGSASRSRRSRLPSTSSCTQSAMMALARKTKVGPTRINIEALESLFE